MENQIKLKTLNKYTLFTREQMKLKSKHFSVRDKFKEIAKKWKNLSNEQKDIYEKRAEEENAKLIGKDDLTNTHTIQDVSNEIDLSLSESSSSSDDNN